MIWIVRGNERKNPEKNDGKKTEEEFESRECLKKSEERRDNFVYFASSHRTSHITVFPLFYLLLYFLLYSSFILPNSQLLRYSIFF